MYSEEIAEEKSTILSKKWYKKKFNRQEQIKLLKK